MNIFEQTRQRIQQAQQQGQNPLVIFDLDDTLIDCRHRKHRVIQDFIAQPEIQEAYAYECQLLAQMHWENAQYRVLDTVAQHGVQNSLFAERLLKFWRQHYFTYPYLIDDKPFPQALAYVEHCHKLGAITVYLTGRDVPGMGSGTHASLHKLGFPTTGDRVHFILKEDPVQGDLDFKVQALESIAKIGHVIAALENELPNLNAMADRFPEAAMYWRKTLYLPNPPDPHPRVEVLMSFPIPPLS